MKHQICDSCEVLFINGLKCHEHGCPDAWKDQTLECKWCGSKFKPAEKYQQFCEDSCYRAYYNLEKDN